MLNRRPSMTFGVGNAGDIFARRIIDHFYASGCRNVRQSGRRLLLVGSIAHRLLPGDVLCGIGTQHVRLPKWTSAPAAVFGVRGPITLEALGNAGHDLRDVRFVGDPGILIRRMVSDQDAIGEGRALFIPHYRERYDHPSRLGGGIELIDIDQEPLQIARHILGADIVYASSLHGIIFSHALGRPCVPIAPQTPEPSIKYEDYFASNGLTWKRPPASIYDVRHYAKPMSPQSVDVDRMAAAFPTLDELVELGVVETSDHDAPDRGVHAPIDPPRAAGR